GTAYSLAEIELVAGDPAAAEAAVRPGYDAFTKMGEKGFRSGGAIYLARALYEQGRYDEVDEFVEVMRTDGGPQEEMHRRAVQAKLLARRGATDKALDLAHRAVALAERGETPLLHARVLTDLAEVLRVLGRNDEAATALEDALLLHERKQNLPGVAQARRLLASVSSAATA